VVIAAITISNPDLTDFELESAAAMTQRYTRTRQQNPDGADFQLHSQTEVASRSFHYQKNWA
jgi:hypothetical protein